jgi:peptide-methionine (R)-S-oxide reductase
MKASLFLAMLANASLLCAAEPTVANSEKKSEPTKPSVDTPSPSPKVTKSDEDWRNLLTTEQFRVARKAGTEAPHGKAYEEFNAQGEGTYYCVCCASELFTSSTKFHSGCGWPSFYDQSKAKNVAEKVDDTHGMRRVEVVCKVCDAHLGHVFEKEGFNTPTDRRYCINGVSMTFVEKGGKAPEPKGKTEEKKDPKEAKK